jgi:hypothetical protein
MADDKRISEEKRGPYGDARPDADRSGKVTSSTTEEKVEDRENVSTVTPEDYPLADRENSAVDGRQGDRSSGHG